MPEQWTGELIGKMHNCSVTYDDLAKQTGWTKGYLSMILNGSRNPADGRKTLEAAFAAILKERRQSE